MKTKYSITILVCALLVGCATMFSSIVTITEVCDSAMRNWAHLSNTGQTTLEFDAKVVKAYDTYRDAAAVASLALQTHKETGNHADFTSALMSARDGALPLINLIAQLLHPTDAANLKQKLSKASAP